MKDVILGIAALSVVASGIALIVTHPPSPHRHRRHRDGHHRKRARTTSKEEGQDQDQDQDQEDHHYLQPPRTTRGSSRHHRHHHHHPDASESDVSVLSSDESRSDVSSSSWTDPTVYSDDNNSSLSASSAVMAANHTLASKLSALEEQLEYANGQRSEMKAEYEGKVATIQASVEQWQKQTEKKWKAEVEASLRETYESRLAVANDEVVRLKKQCAVLNREMHKERARNQSLSDGASIRSRASTLSLRSRRESLVPASP